MNKNTPLNSGMQPDLKTEVAIIGAGMSGLYTAYRLTEEKKYTGSQVQIFDLLNRIGGRLESVKLPEMDVVGELGGMRYLTSQEIVTTLIEKVFKNEMQWVDFPMGNEADLLMYLRKERFKQDAWTQAQAKGEVLQTRFYLNDDDIGFSSDQLFNKVFYDVLMADRWVRKNYGSKITKGPSKYDYSFSLTNEDWNAIKPRLRYRFKDSPYNGRLVNDLGFWNLLKDQVSQEGYTFLGTAGGYYSNTINWNAAEAFQNMIGDFSPGTKYRTIESGYDSIAFALANAYMKHKGACIWSENKLVTFTKNHKHKGEYKYMLEFLNIPQNKRWRVYANRIVLAMPRNSLELLDQNNFFFKKNTRNKLGENLVSVIKEPAFKILMGFDYPWWKALNIDSGHSITDLPMRQCYYFGTDPNNQHSMLLGSYGDMETETFWKALSEDKVMFQFKLHLPKTASQAELAALENVQASDLMVKELMKQLRELHGDLVEIPDPYVTWFRDWTDDPFGAGYHAWKAGYSVKHVMPYMRKPLKREDIHICGEAYSDGQGWVEGAFCVAENMLEEYFGLERPKWLNEDYYLGW